ncbi:thioredoxin domain-containing protein [Wolbachia endosymbiont of Dirofilaria (Dirofilaria) immitis]|uniref:thioredoxin domain-containing protein n=1 Tax=Wolbachia endosymbiont of Dirofilaria (Dirofilaria) immitis TaxID=1812115 RepID=UPI001589543F|nr:thioredoxin domain-containing protein [Wolbachia endosymbiont of Dirofilaria (Dirofilaria) immitis]QKX02398.1 thioredoxin domain-containing protein [Wolbachia endosymbiont of Dirofilaria (Dirofilaria) immitis]
MIFRLVFALILISVDSYALVEQDLFDDQCTRKTSEITPKELLSPLPDDKLLGDPKAPILMIEYASLTCYHCYLFHKEVFPKIKKKYVDTGKMLYIFRHFPMDYRGLKAAMLSYCYERTEDYFNFNKAVFNLIDSWNYSNFNDLTVLQKVAALSNLKQDTFNQCINDKKIMDKVISDKSLAINKLGITGTPIFFIRPTNDKLYVEHDKIKHEGYKTLEYLASIIDSYVKKL